MGLQGNDGGKVSRMGEAEMMSNTDRHPNGCTVCGQFNCSGHLFDNGRWVPPRRNITTTELFMTGAQGEHVTIRRCFEDGTQFAILVYVNGWRTREYKTDKGLTRYLASITAS